jgi:MraZ protein
MGQEGFMARVAHQIVNTPNSNEVIRYNGVVLHGVDDKRRVQIPSRWRPSDPKVELTVIVWPKHTAGICLRVLPPKEMDELMAEIDALPSSDPDKPLLKRIIGSRSVQVTLDNAGRITVPADMAKAAGIEAGGEAKLVGLLDRFEIWDPKRYEAVEVADDARMMKAFDRME